MMAMVLVYLIDLEPADTNTIFAARMTESKREGGVKLSDRKTRIKIHDNQPPK